MQHTIFLNTFVSKNVIGFALTNECITVAHWIGTIPKCALHTHTQKEQFLTRMFPKLWSTICTHVSKHEREWERKNAHSVTAFCNSYSVSISFHQFSIFNHKKIDIRCCIEPHSSYKNAHIEAMFYFFFLHHDTSKQNRIQFVVQIVSTVMAQCLIRQRIGASHNSVA